MKTLTKTQLRVLVAIRDGSFHCERPSDAAVVQRLRREGFWWWAHGSEARRELSPAGLAALMKYLESLGVIEVVAADKDGAK